MKIIVNYWNPVNAWVKYKNGGGLYYCTDPKIVETEEHDILSEEDKFNLFALIYQRNNRLRYCNGSYWKFTNKEIENEYRHSFLPKYNTIKHFYGNGVVD